MCSVSIVASMWGFLVSISVLYAGLKALHVFTLFEVYSVTHDSI